MKLIIQYKMSLLRLLNSKFPILILVAVVSNFKNFFTWNNYVAFSNNYFHYNIIDLGIKEVHMYVLMSILVLWTFPLTLWNFSQRYFLFLSGVVNILIPMSDLLILHHDMLFSGVLFLLGSFYSTNELDRYPMKVFILAVYLSAGLAKLNLDFFDGSVIELILSRIHLDIFPRVLYAFFALTAAFIEIVIPLIIIFRIKNKVIVASVLILACFYHLLLLSTGTGTLFNLIYTFFFLTLLQEQKFNGHKFIKRIIIKAPPIATSFIYAYSFLFLLKNSIYDLWMKF